jgi:deoxyribodipyrimidine photo-lyase
MIKQQFPTDLPSIYQRLENLDLVDYCKTRNFSNGTVSYLSPYISRGVLSTKQILSIVAKKNLAFHDIEIFIKELMWRDYFQRVWIHCNIDIDIKHKQIDVLSHLMPRAIVKAQTGIESIDKGIELLYETGYMHNHLRMYTASFACNTLKYHWNLPAQWMYYHLLDGDWASNACSWQWVCGSFSSNKYFANQDNINKYTGSTQKNSLLDVSYDDIERVIPPAELLFSSFQTFDVTYPIIKMDSFDNTRPTFLYNYYNLDATWRSEKSGNRVLMIEPDVFEKYPISDKCMQFMLDLAQNVPNMLVFVGSFEEFKTAYKPIELYYKEHPLAGYYNGTRDKRDWICEDFDEYYPSFFQYWKRCEPIIKKEYFG